MDDKLKVVLVVPNFRWSDWDKNTLWHFIPYNLCLLAAMIEDICEVKIIDANVENMGEDELYETFVSLKPDVVGITVLMDQYGPSGHRVAEIAKRYNENTKTVIGGVYATVNTDEVIKDENIDFVVAGEGEYVLKDLIEYFIGKKDIPEKGITYKLNGKIINGGHSEFIEDMNALPLPAYHLIDYEKYSNDKFVTRKSVDSPRAFPFARITTSRGCPYGCCFCQVETISGKPFRPRSAQNVLKEIRWLKEKYGVRALTFDDDNLYTDKKRSKEIFQGMIEQDLVMPWSSIAVAVFRLDQELVHLMRESGCEYMNIAIESGNERVLKQVIKKPVSYQYAREIVAEAKKKGIYVAANFIVGFPTETWDEIRETIQFAEEIDVDYVKIFAAIPLRSTRLWDLSVQSGAIKEGFTQAGIRWTDGQIETKDFTARDLTILRAYEWDRINFTNTEKRKRTADIMGISEGELLKIRRETLMKAASLPES